MLEAREMKKARAVEAPDPQALLLSVPQAALLLGIGESLARLRVAEGTLRSVRDGRRVLVPRAAIAEYVEALVGQASA